ncbi:MAG: 23S rRNA (adenine(2503)-C(2))-methyltransferase RlmN, partial [Leptospiraceae bacterium]|nr:23S rRNA (adenine(2503)-C(2))-methyltransferase RlmN [Leptospiraceae bacterium]
MFVLKGSSISELEEFFISIGEKKFRAKQVFQGLYADRYKSIEEFSVLSKELKQKLKNISVIPSIQLKKKIKSIDGTVKFIFEVEPNREIESVWIPTGDGNRKTICVSSQVGCTLSCAFCATGKLEFQGNLKSWQIVDQVLQIENILNDRATNIVYMGMGEPMHNYFSVMKSAHILHSSNAFNIGSKKIT